MGEGLEQVFVQEFKLRFACAIHPSQDTLASLVDIISPSITELHNRQLLLPILDEEIWDAVNSIGALKAPSPDGLCAAFFQNYWNELKDTVSPSYD